MWTRGSQWALLDRHSGARAKPASPESKNTVRAGPKPQLLRGFRDDKGTGTDSKQRDGAGDGDGTEEDAPVAEAQRHRDGAAAFEFRASQ